MLKIYIDRGLTPQLSVNYNVTQSTQNTSGSPLSAGIVALQLNGRAWLLCDKALIDSSVSQPESIVPPY